MSMVFLSAMRSSDQQTKQGAIIVDWPSKAVIGLGYNGHPRGASDDLPTMRAGSVKHGDYTASGTLYHRGDCIPPGKDRDEAIKNFPEFIQGNPDKYVYMCHCETNALLSVNRPSNNAVLYIPMPSCEACGALILNHPTVKITRIVYYEDRNFRNHIYSCRPDVVHEKWDTNNLDPADLLERTATYIRLRKAEGEALSAQSTKTYR
jgi:deoxycytidylate deaminase